MVFLHSSIILTRILSYIDGTTLYRFTLVEKFAGSRLIVAPLSIWKMISRLSVNMRHLSHFLCLSQDFSAFTEWMHSS